MNKYVKYTLRFLGVLLALLIVIYTTAYIYVVIKRQEIISQIRTQVAEKLNGNVQIGNIDLGFFSSFPGVAIELQNVVITDTVYNSHKHPFFRAQEIDASISILSLIEKENPLYGIRIENGEIYIYTDTAGYTNSYLLQPKSKPAIQRNSSPNSRMNLEKLKLRNVRFVVDDKLKKKLFDIEFVKFNCKIKPQDSGYRYSTENNLIIHSFAFNTDAGSFVKETPLVGDYKVYFDRTKKELSFKDIDFTLKKQEFNMTGAFDFGDSASFRLQVNADKIGYDFGRGLLTEKIAAALAIVKVQDPIKHVTASVSGPLKGGDPLVNIDWTVDHAGVQTPYANFTDCSFTGSYNNEVVKGLPRKDPNSRLEFHDFVGHWEGLELKSKNIHIDNLVTPVITCDLKTNFQLTQLNDALQSNTIGFSGGTGSVDISYFGPMQANTNRNTLINGKVNFVDGVVDYLPRGFQMKSLNGNILFKNTDVFVTDLRSNVMGSRVVMNGSGKNLLNALRTNPGRAFIDWNIYASTINLGIIEKILAVRTQATQRKKSRSKLGLTATYVDEAVNQANFHLDLKADELVYKKFSGSNLKASLSLDNNNWFLQKVSLQHAGGSMNINGNLLEKNSRYYTANLKVDMNNVDVNKVFYAFDNFGQNGIESKNLRGKLFTNANVKLDINRNLSQSPSNISGFVDFSLRKGALLHFEPLQSLQNVVFKNRNFDEIYFAELKDHFDINNREIIINRMEIQSTILTLYVQGIYSLDNKTDISIQVPLSNLKKRDENYKPTNKGADSKGGASIYVRGQPGNDGKIKFKLDVFRKFRKNKVEAEKEDMKKDDPKKTDPAKPAE